MLKISSWNVNSLKVRLTQVLDWLKLENPDVLALQELKQADEFFPKEIFKSAGYPYIAVNGQKTYNGVAIISKYKLDNIEKPDPDEQHRIISVSTHNLRIINLYIPNGQSVSSAKYEYKLNWLKYLISYLSDQLKKYPELILTGDFNIAPEKEDVHDPVLWQDKILFSQPEKQAFQDILKLGFVDSFRLFSQPPKSYSWWDYRLLGFRRNAGLRIDHIIISKMLEKNCRQSAIDKTPRAWQRPSDHAPVIAGFKI